MMNAVGGTSVHYMAQSWRLSPWDFKVRSETMRRSDLAGEATRVTIGKYSTGTITEGSGAVASLEASQADVDVRIYNWTAAAEIKEPSKQAADLMSADSDLHIEKQSLVIDPGRLPPGRYRLSLQLTDDVRGLRAASASIEFRLR